MDRMFFWAVVIGILLLGAWGADMKKKDHEQNPPQYSTPFMRCGLLPSYREVRDCMQREGIDNIDIEDPKAEPRRK